MMTLKKRWIRVTWQAALTVLTLIGMIDMNHGGPCTSGYGYLMLGPFVILFGILTLVSTVKVLKMQRQVNEI